MSIQLDLFEPVVETTHEHVWSSWNVESITLGPDLQRYGYFRHCYACKKSEEYNSVTS
jgi:hypothetical protein